MVPPNFLLKLKFLTSLIKTNYRNMQDLEIHAANKDTEKNVFFHIRDLIKTFAELLVWLVQLL